MSMRKSKIRSTNNNNSGSGLLFVRCSSMQLFKFGATMCVIAAVGLFVWKLYQPDTLRFRTVQVFGNLQWMTKDKLDPLILEAMDGGFFSLDVKALKLVLEQQAWIRSVSVRRVWPDVLQVVVNEQKPIAIWNNKMLINVDSEIFHPLAEGIPENMVRVAGPVGTHQFLMRHYLVLQEMLLEQGLQISQIQINDRRAMEIRLDNGMHLLMGRVHDELDSIAELSRFVRAYRLVLAPNIDRISLVDLRYTNGLAVRWKPTLNASARLLRLPENSSLQPTLQESDFVVSMEKSNNKIAQLMWDNMR
ncbi:MAG: FtsQ-type POTRA domain-containing protein [Gammaproteobacteria bacterium]|nr:FtsQ-type POTRA domain-containing protein [Gammaproteobacteria bacterium]